MSSEHRPAATPTPMRFQQFGKTYQLRIETPDDLDAVLELDESLWVATSAPIDAFRCDPRFTALMNRDGSGRVNTDEVKDAIGWLLDVLEDRSQLTAGIDSVPFSSLRQSSSAAEALTASARYVLKTLGRTNDDSISLDLVRRFQANMRAQPVNGDGVIVAEAAKDPGVADFIRDVVECSGGSPDASGETGATEEQFNTFQAEVLARLEWLERSRAHNGTHASVMPFGDDTPRLYSVFREYAEHVDHFFALCHAVAFEPNAVSRMGNTDMDLSKFDFTARDDVNAFLARAPMARPTPVAHLPLTGPGVNPFYRTWLESLRDNVLNTVLNESPDELTEPMWTRVRAALQPYADYLAEEKGTSVKALPREKLETYRNGERLTEALKLVEDDKTTASLLKRIEEVERLVLYHRYMLRFLNNFVNFSQLYKPDSRALFEMGSAVLDGRWFNLALKTSDMTSHSALAAGSNIFTMYLEITGKTPAETYHVAVPATSGSKGNLAVGKRGVFFDINDAEHDARVVKIIENPISLREALVAPFVRLWAFVLGKIEAISSESEKKLQKTTDSAINAPVAAPAPGVQSGPAGILVGLSVSAAAIGAAFAFITETFAEMSGTQALFGLLGAACVVVVPVTVIAIIKLRRQDLSSLLEGCGWAINARMRFNRAQRRHFTRRARYPLNATGTPRHRWAVLLVIAVLLTLVLAGRHCLRMRERHADTSSPVDPPPAPATAAQP